MSVNLKPLNEQVIVITGASSGIGLATALAAAEEGAKLVLASRNETGLADIARKLKAKGISVLTVTADVGQKEDIDKIAQAAISKFGGFDTWVNNAGVSIWGKLEQVTDEDHRRLFDTNFWGLVYGSLTAAKHLKDKGGAIINLGSELSEHAVTLQGMYAASKHAVKGFTDSLRMELEESGVPISVTLVKPAAIATPFANHVKNYTDKQPKLPQPIYAPEEVAYAILHAAATPTRDVFVGGGAKGAALLSKLAPRLFDWVAENIFTRAQLRDAPARPHADNLHQSASNGDTRGQNMGFVMEKSLYTRATLHPLASMLILGGVGLALAAAIMPRLKTTTQQRATDRLRHLRARALSQAKQQAQDSWADKFQQLKQSLRS